MSDLKKSKSHSFMGNVAIVLIAQLMVKLLGMVYRIVITNIDGFGDSGNAFYTAGFQIYTVLLAISSVGIPNAIAKVEELKKQYKPTRVPTPTKKGDYSGVVKVQGGIVYPDDRKNIFVYIPDTDIVTMTDDKGRFFLRGVKNVNDVHAIVARKGKSGQPGLNIKGTIL